MHGADAFITSCQQMEQITKLIANKLRSRYCSRIYSRLRFQRLPDAQTGDWFPAFGEPNRSFVELCVMSPVFQPFNIFFKSFNAPDS
jgi:nuclear transport factor 2 (NTF2) superfamily protein